jgi:hypothetical protein
MTLATASSRVDNIRRSLVGVKMPRALEMLDVTLRRIEQGQIDGIEALDELLLEELSLRENRRIKAALRMARVPVMKTLAGFDFAFQPSLDRNRIMALAGLDFIARAEVVHLLGPPGTGKSPLATALAVEAVRRQARLLHPARRPRRPARQGRTRGHTARTHPLPQAPLLRVPLADGTLVATPEVPSSDLIPSILALSDVTGTGWFAADAANVRPGATVVVVGDGAVGLLGVLSARLMGAERIIAMSRHATRQKLALVPRRCRAKGPADLRRRHDEGGHVRTGRWADQRPHR